MSIKLQLRTLRRNVVRRHRKVGRGPRDGRFTFRKSEHQARHSQFAHWLSRWPAGLVRDRSGPSSIRRERSNKTKLPRPDRAGQRCKWRLVCEWVCTVTSVSVRIEKRANCAKNNKPKSGGLFLVNARPFPEHSSSIATFSAGRAWLEARFEATPRLKRSSFLGNKGHVRDCPHVYQSMQFLPALSIVLFNYFQLFENKFFLTNY